VLRLEGRIEDVEACRSVLGVLKAINETWNEGKAYRRSLVANSQSWCLSFQNLITRLSIENLN